VALLAVFSACLLLCVLVSGTPARWVLSAALVFLVGGAFASRLGWVSLRPDSPVVDAVLSLALFALLFLAGLQLRAADLRPSRLLLVAGSVALAVAAVSLLTHFAVGFDLLPALIIGTALAPTGPLLVGHRSRHALTAGLAVPLLVVLVSAAGGQNVVTSAMFPLAGGLALGVALPAAAYLLVRLPGLGPAARHHPLVLVAVAVLTYTVAHLTGVNPLLAAFAGGATIAVIDPAARDGFAPLGGHLLTLAGGAGMLIFGALLTPALIRGTPGLTWLAVALVVIIIRPATTALGLPSRPVLAAAWVEPQPFITVLLALVVLRSGLPGAPAAYGFLAVAIVVGVVLHSATDVVVASRLGSRSRPAGRAT